MIRKDLVNLKKIDHYFYVITEIKSSQKKSTNLEVVILPSFLHEKYKW